MSDLILASELIIENNHQFLVAAKPSGMPVQDDKSDDLSLQAVIQGYTKQKLHLHTRLDRPVSGLVLFSKKEGARKNLLLQEKNGKMEKVYLAAVSGQISIDGELVHFHRKDGRKKKADILDKPRDGYKQISLHAKTISQLDRYSILSISLKTGAFHQIRAQLSKIGHPIKGDVKYGARRGNKDRSIHLHAYQIKFKHPVTSEDLKFEMIPKKIDGIWKGL